MVIGNGSTSKRVSTGNSSSGAGSSTQHQHAVSRESRIRQKIQKAIQQRIRHQSLVNATVMAPAAVTTRTKGAPQRDGGTGAK